MAHFAELDENNNVIAVIVVNNSDIDDLEFPESEPKGIEYLRSLGIEGKFLQTSFNRNFRGDFGRPEGWVYDEEKDEFVGPEWAIRDPE